MKLTPWCRLTCKTIEIFKDGSRSTKADAYYDTVPIAEIKKALPAIITRMTDALVKRYKSRNAQLHCALDPSDKHKVDISRLKLDCMAASNILARLTPAMEQCHEGGSINYHIEITVTVKF